MAVPFFNPAQLTARVLLCLSLVLTSFAHSRAQSTKSTDAVVVTATLTTKKGLLVGLKAENFNVFIDDQPAKILYARTEDAPLSVGIVFDASGSAGFPGSSKASRARVEDLQRAIKAFIEKSNQANEYFVQAFNKTPQLLLDWSSDSNAIVGALGGVQPKGITAFYDACYLAIDKVQHGRYEKRVLLVISDGQDNDSHYKFTQVREALKESNVLVYAVTVSDLPDAGSSLGAEGQGILEELVAWSGGQAYHDVESRDAAMVLAAIAAELKNQYTIAIEPSVRQAENRRWHKLKLKVKAPDKIKLSVRTRQGFYSH